MKLNRLNLGRIKVMWFDRYYTYLIRPLTVIQMIITIYLGVIFDFPIWLLVSILVLIFLYSFFIARHDRKVLAQEMEYYARINPFFQGLESDVKEVVEYVRSQRSEKDVQKKKIAKPQPA